MSDRRLGNTGNPFTVCSVRALDDTRGMSPPEQANYWLEQLTQAVHRGPRLDTWTSARDRAARAAGISPAMAERIWHRWREMKDVSGGALIKLMVAYEVMHRASEAAENEYQGSVDRSKRMETVLAALQKARGDQMAQRRSSPAGRLVIAGVA